MTKTRRDISRHLQSNLFFTVRCVFQVFVSTYHQGIVNWVLDDRESIFEVLSFVHAQFFRPFFERLPQHVLVFRFCYVVVVMLFRLVFVALVTDIPVFFAEPRANNFAMYKSYTLLSLCAPLTMTLCSRGLSFGYKDAHSLSIRCFVVSLRFDLSSVKYSMCRFA